MHTDNATTSAVEVSYAYQLFMLFLCVYAILSLAAGVLFPMRAEFIAILGYVDFAVCAVFFVDFLISFTKAENKAKYFFTWGWIDLLSSIPAVDVLRFGRLARVLRIIRVLRAFRAMQYLIKHLVSRRTSSAFYSILAVSFSLIVVSALAVLRFEIDGPGTIKTAEGALWWAMTTITTVGYGDLYPVTAEGRIVAAVLMVGGVGLFGTLSGVVASWFISPREPTKQSESEELRRSVEALRAQLDRLQGTLSLHGANTPAVTRPAD